MAVTCLVSPLQSVLHTPVHASYASVHAWSVPSERGASHGAVLKHFPMPMSTLLVIGLAYCGASLQRPPLRVPAAASRACAITMSDQSKSDAASSDGASKKSLLDQVAEASFDIFVMPGEYANSQYDRVFPDDEQPAASDGAEETGEQRKFNWGGDGAESEALRLPTGVKAAERLSVPVARPPARWFERQGPSSDEEENRRRVAGDIELLSQGWTRLWAVCVVVTLAVVVADAPPPSS